MSKTHLGQGGGRSMFGIYSVVNKRDIQVIILTSIGSIN